jgi:hypothetical protein
MMNPDWWLWDAHEEVMIWQAVALSLNIDPEAMPKNQIRTANGYGGRQSEPFANSVTADEFGKRQRLLEKRFAREPIFAVFDQDGEEPYIANKVALHDVARLLTSLGREVPLEFGAFVNTAVRFPTAPSEAYEPTRTPPATPSYQPVKRPRGRMVEQQQTIEAALNVLGHLMGEIPRCKPGKDGLRSQIREVVGGNPLFAADTSFDKAYDAVLRRDKELANKQDYKPMSNSPPHK